MPNAIELLSYELFNKDFNWTVISFWLMELEQRVSEMCDTQAKRKKHSSIKRWKLERKAIINLLALSDV